MNECLLCFNSFSVNLNYYELLLPQKNKTRRICSNCLQKFERLTKNICKNCCKSLEETKAFCEDCQYWSRIYKGKTLKNTSHYKYNQAFHDLMVQYKRYGDYELRFLFQDLLLDLPSADLYVPIPSSPGHLSRRGFETVESIYRQNIKLTCLLEKNDLEEAQGKKNRKERLNSKQTFKLRENIKVKKLDVKRILLLDDIYTTGRTLYHARDALVQDFPSVNIQSFTLAR